MGNPRARVGKKKKGLPRRLSGTESTCNAGDKGEASSIPAWGRDGGGNATHSRVLAWEIPWTEELVGYCPWGHTESDTTEWPSKHSRETEDEPGVEHTPGSAE